MERIIGLIQGIIHNIYIIPFIIGLMFLIRYIVAQDFIKDHVSKKDIYISKIKEKIMFWMLKISSYAIPPKHMKIYESYRVFLQYSKFSVEQFFRIKLVIGIIVFLFTLAIKFTNISMYTTEVKENFEYTTDVIFKQQEDDKKVTEYEKSSIHIQKKYFINKAIKTLDKTFFVVSKDPQFEQTRKEGAQAVILDMIKKDGTPVLMTKEALANEMFYRLETYYKIRQFNFGLYLLVVIVFYFIPDVLIAMLGLFIKIDAKKELRFLKKLIIMNGSIKPVDFMDLLKVLISKSTYYKKVLLEIEDLNKKNYLDNTKIYTPLIQGSKDIESKLFFEKLDEANNYDFDQAVLNIKNEFNLDKRMQSRKIKKITEIIHVWGIVGYMLLIVLVILYLLLPWMKAYNMNQIM